VDLTLIEREVGWCVVYRPNAHQAKGHADDLIAGMAKAGEETDREYPARPSGDCISF
jgi:hypothetical protein